MPLPSSSSARAAETIYAPSSPLARCATLVIRVSGPGAALALTRCRRASAPPAPRRAVLTRFYHPETDELLDEGLALWFPAPASFTGEDVAEWHVHGSPAGVRRCLEALESLPGYRMAHPGEFVRRAYDHRKTGLTELEGLADFLAAETEAQARQALRQMSGEAGEILMRLSARLTKARALLEAWMDFPDEDIPESALTRFKEEAESVRRELERFLGAADRAERVRGGVDVVLFGAPNAGKSTLLNALAACELAIVSPLAGTTRDAVRASLNLGGWPVNLIDTAGLRETSDPVEQEGVRRTRKLIQEAHVRVAVADGSVPLPPETLAYVTADTLLVLTHADREAEAGAAHLAPPPCALTLSLAPGPDPEGACAALTRELERAAAASLEDDGAAALVTRERRRRSLQEAADALALAPSRLDVPEIAAEYLRMAAGSLGEAAGYVDHEDVLDSLFREFCIGK